MMKTGMLNGEPRRREVRQRRTVLLRSALVVVLASLGFVGIGGRVPLTRRRAHDATSDPDPDPPEAGTKEDSLTPYLVRLTQSLRCRGVSCPAPPLGDRGYVCAQVHHASCCRARDALRLGISTPEGAVAAFDAAVASPRNDSDTDNERPSVFVSRAQANVPPDDESAPAPSPTLQNASRPRCFYPCADPPLKCSAFSVYYIGRVGSGYFSDWNFPEIWTTARQVNPGSAVAAAGAVLERRRSTLQERVAALDLSIAARSTFMREDLWVWLSRAIPNDGRRVRVAGRRVTKHEALLNGYRHRCPVLFGNVTDRTDRCVLFAGELFVATAPGQCRDPRDFVARWVAFSGVPFQEPVRWQNDDATLYPAALKDHDVPVLTLPWSGQAVTRVELFRAADFRTVADGYDRCPAPIVLAFWIQHLLSLPPTKATRAALFRAVWDFGVTSPWPKYCHPDFYMQEPGLLFTLAAAIRALRPTSFPVGFDVNWVVNMTSNKTYRLSSKKWSSTDRLPAALERQASELAASDNAFVPGCRFALPSSFFSYPWMPLYGLGWDGD